jgi:8-oxo-dGTP pyrophosphatase MutT (NUDIX family)
MAVFTCPDGCCILKMQAYERSSTRKPRIHPDTVRRKAGVLVHDSDTDRILIVQSRGHLWGPPKGTTEEGESDLNCALRELTEETGLVLGPETFQDTIKIRDRATYFYALHPEHDPEVQSHLPNNDANAVAWIKPACLERCVADGNICTTRHLRFLLGTLFDISLPPSTFDRVERTGRRRQPRARTQR